MDIFMEELVEKRKSFLEVVAVFGLMLLSVAIAFVLMTVVTPLVPQFSAVIVMLSIGIFYIAYKFSMTMNVEYEYSLVNYEMDVDKIINRKNRKRMTTVNIRKAEAFGNVNEMAAEFSRYAGDISVKKIYAAKRRDSENNFYVVYSEDTMRKLLVFSPSEKMAETIEKIKPKKI